MADLRLSTMFRGLRKRGFFAKRNFWCCQSCAWCAVDEGQENVAFLHKQDEEGWRERGKACIAWRGDGQAIVDEATKAGLQVKWDGLTSTRIQVSK